MDRNHETRRTGWARAAVLAVLGGVLLSAGCPTKPAAVSSPHPAKAGPGSIGVVIVVDTSGSMKESVPAGNGQNRPKYQLANEALTEILRQTQEWTAANQDKPLNLAITTFSDKPRPVLKMGQFDNDSAQKGVKAIPGPDGGTAIGDALRDSWSSLKPVGCERQYLLCITDGQNTTGRRPEEVVPEIFNDSGGKVEIHFIAFDVNSNLFDFAKKYNGQVVSASNKEDLDRELKRIFKKNIFGEGD
jgi:Mg-chelatase subunit ChlD